MLVHTKWHIPVQTKWPDADQIQTPSCTLPQLSGYEYDIGIAKATKDEATKMCLAAELLRTQDEATKRQALGLLERMVHH